jgi:hypothetical protein
MQNKTKLMPELIFGTILLVMGLYKMEENIILNSLISLLGVILIMVYVLLNFVIKRTKIKR